MSDRRTGRAATRVGIPCPGCGVHGREVSDETIAAILDPQHARIVLSEPRNFCRNPTCPVVYYGEHHRVDKGNVPVRVGLKENEDPVPLCYCFGFTRADVWNEIAHTGSTTIPARIADEVRAGHCACTTKNPSGICCLGEVNRAVAQARAGRRGST